MQGGERRIGGERRRGGPQSGGVLGCDRTQWRGEGRTIAKNVGKDEGGKSKIQDAGASNMGQGETSKDTRGVQEGEAQLGTPVKVGC